MRFIRESALFLALALALASCKEGTAAPEKPKATAEPGVDVELAPPAMKAAKLVVAPARVAVRGGALVAVGALELSPKHVAKVGTMVDGRIVGVKVQIGDKVKAGEALATLESSAAGRARAEFFQAEARLRLADKELTREKQLQGEGVTSQRTLGAAETEREVAGYELRAASERLRAVGLSTAGGSGRDGKPTSAVLALSTPIAGVVLVARPKLGEAVQASDDLFTIGDISELWLMVEVYERDLPHLHEGDAARVTVIAAPNRVFEGRVDHIGEAIDPMRHAADVRIVLANVDGALRPGMSATARLALTAPASPSPSPSPSPSSSSSPSPSPSDDGKAVLIAKSAIQMIDGLPHVFIEKSPGKYELRAVVVGPAYEGDIEIPRGLEAGEQVVVDGAFILKSQLLRDQMGSND